MYVSAREQSILHLLLDNSDGITIQTLAEALNVSIRTIQRDLKGVEETLDAYHLSLEKKVGFGLKIQGQQHDREHLQNFLSSLDRVEYTPEERQLLLLMILLHDREPVKLFALANKLKVTEATVSHDLTKVEQWLESFELDLIRKRGYGIKIEGPEQSIRRALGGLINENLNEANFYRVLASNFSEQEGMTDLISEHLLHLVDFQTLRDVQQAVTSLRKQTEEHMADSSYMGLIVHTAIAIERIRQGEKIEMAPEYLQQLTLHKEYRLAAQLARELEAVFKIDIPAEEIGYMTMYLLGAKLRYEHEALLEEPNLRLAVRVKQLIEGVEEELQMPLHDESLFNGLLSHLKPAIYRVRQNMKIYNPLLEKIREDHHDLFHIVREQARRVLELEHIPDEEIGFLVMHFGSAIERRMRRSDLTALVICSSGIGTSKLLTNRLQREFPEITTIKNASLFDLEDKRLDEYDLLISTIPLKNVAHYFLVSPFLWKKEVAQISDFIEQYQRKKWRSKRDESHGTKDIKQLNQTSVDRFGQIAAISDDIVSILTSFHLQVMEQGDSLEEGLHKICQEYELKGFVTNASVVVKALFDREVAGGVAIPETSLALFHTRNEWINRPCLAICELKTPAIRKGMDGGTVSVERALVLLAPLQMSEQRLSFMSFLSTLVIENESYTKMFASGSQQEVSEFLAASCQNYLQNVMNQGVDDE